MFNVVVSFTNLNDAQAFLARIEREEYVGIITDANTDEAVEDE